MLGFALLVAAAYGLDYLLCPWAYARSGQRPLTGYWHGEIVFEPGDRRDIAVQLTHPLGAYGSRASKFNIIGTAKVCALRRSRSN